MGSKQFKDTFHWGIVKMGTEGAIEPTFFEHNFIYINTYKKISQQFYPKLYFSNDAPDQNMYLKSVIRCYAIKELLRNLRKHSRATLHIMSSRLLCKL